MMHRGIGRWAGTAMIVAVCSVAIGAQQSPRQLFERARVMEESARTLNQALAMYEQVVAQAPNDRALAAAAQFRIGVVKERQGKPEAKVVFASIVRDYKDQPAIVAPARARLSASAGSLQLELTPRRVFDGGFDVPLDMSADGRFTVGRLREGYNSGPGTGAGIILRDTQTGSTTRLGASFQARISRDGQRVAIGCNDSAKFGLCTIGTAPGSSAQLILQTSPQQNITAVDWFPDGKSILVLVQGNTTTSMELAQLSLETKSIRTIKTFEQWQSINGRLLSSRVSPDGQFVAFVMRPQRDQEHSLYTIDVAGQNENRIVLASGPNDIPLWTPDGSHLLFVGEVGGQTGLFSVAVRDGRAAGDPVLEQRDSGFLAPGDRTGGGSAFYLHPLVMTTSGTLYYARTTGNINYEFIANRTSAAGEHALAFAGIHGSWSPQGLFAFLRETGGDDPDLIIRDMSSGAETRYTRPGIDLRRELHWLRDGSGVIAFVDEDPSAGQPSAVYELERATGVFRRLCDVQANGHWRSWGGISPDNKTLYLAVSAKSDGPVNGIVAVDIATGEERSVVTFDPTTQSAGNAIDVSPDGTTLAVIVPVHSPDAKRIFTVGVDGTGYREVVASLPTGWNNLRWTPDAQSLLFVGSNPDTSWRIMRVSAMGGDPVFDGLDEHGLQSTLPDIKLFPSNFNGFDVTPDGAKIVPSTWTMAKQELWTIDGLLSTINSR